MGFESIAVPTSLADKGKKIVEPEFPGDDGTRCPKPSREKIKEENEKRKRD